MLLLHKCVFNQCGCLLNSSSFSSSQWLVTAAGKRGADLPPLLRGHAGLAVSQRGPAPQPFTPSALCSRGARQQQLRPHHGVRQTIRAVPRSPALSGERRCPGAPGRGPTRVLSPTQGSLLQPTTWREGGPFRASYTSPGHQQEDRLLPL